MSATKEIHIGGMIAKSMSDLPDVVWERIAPISEYLRMDHDERVFTDGVVTVSSDEDPDISGRHARAIKIADATWVLVRNRFRNQNGSLTYLLADAYITEDCEPALLKQKLAEIIPERAQAM